jgi:replicative DNA helicase
LRGGPLRSWWPVRNRCQATVLPCPSWTKPTNGLPLIALSQLNRELTRRSDPRPQLADLAESDAIGQHADQVAFVHRPEVFAPEDDTLRGLAEIIVAKHRHGETGTVELIWAGATTSFRNRPEPEEPI